MDQKSMILGWIIGKQIAGQRKPSKGEPLDITWLMNGVEPTTATVYIFEDFEELPSDGSVYKHEIGSIKSAEILNGHLKLEVEDVV